MHKIYTRKKQNTSRTESAHTARTHDSPCLTEKYSANTRLSHHKNSSMRAQPSVSQLTFECTRFCFFLDHFYSNRMCFCLGNVFKKYFFILFQKIEFLFFISPCLTERYSANTRLSHHKNSSSQREHTAHRVLLRSIARTHGFLTIKTALCAHNHRCPS